MSQERKQSYRQQKLVPVDLSQSLGKLPPQALDLEEAVLGAMMLERSGLINTIDILQPEDFYIDKHREIFQAIRDLFRADKPVDMLTVKGQLQRAGKLELVGGAYQIADLTSKVSSTANAEYNARIIAEMSIRRKLILMASKVHHEAHEDTNDVFETLDEVQREFDQVTGQYLKGNVKINKVIFNQAIQNLLDGKDKKGLTGVPSGYTDLDRLTAGWQKTELTIIAGRPGMGKTAFVVNVLRNAAIDFQIPAAIFSLEMSALQLEQRMIASESEVDIEKIIHAQYEEHELVQISHKTTRLANAPIFIDDTPALSVLELRAKCRRLKAEHKIQLIVVDYLQLMRGDKDGNREQEISSISRALKGIAKDLDVPVLALSQLSRGVETRGGDKRPILADLRESGSIEQDADKVIFLYRPEYYKISVYEDGMPTQGTMEVIVAKNRNGRCDTVKVKFIGKYSKVKDFDISDVTAALPFTPEPGSNFKHYKNNQVSRREHDDPPLPTNKDDAPF